MRTGAGRAEDLGGWRGGATPWKPEETSNLLLAWKEGFSSLPGGQGPGHLADVAGTCGADLSAIPWVGPGVEAPGTGMRGCNSWSRVDKPAVSLKGKRCHLFEKIVATIAAVLLATCI